MSDSTPPNVIGHQHIWAQLLHWYERNTLPNAVVFQGLQGVGKGALACDFAACLVTQNSLDSNAIRHAHHLIRLGAHPGVRVLRRDNSGEEGTHISIAKVREVLHFFRMSPERASDYRVLIVDAIDDLSVAGANTLLKIVEEPPDHVCIIIINHRSERLLPTLKSRAAQLFFNPLSSEEMKDYCMINNFSSQDTLLSLVQGQPGLMKHIHAHGLTRYLEDVHILVTNDGTKTTIGQFIKSWFSAANKAMWDHQLMWIERTLLQQGSQERGMTPRFARLMQTYDNFVKNITHYRTLNLDLSSILWQSLSTLWISER
ncbi:MAG: hypothetical protein H6849_04895 [Alphaproteobacteria bacterium]|nr:MAG: hypothetical protein H6849_04895 [Alphaproteobacteria bacterium]